MQKDSESSTTMFKILRWLAEDRSRTLPPPDDDDGIQELAQAVGKSPDYVRHVMEWNLRPGLEGHTPNILT